MGFGSQKKENLTGAVSQVKMDDVLGSRPVVNAMSALQGTMPGLQITPNGDAAGPGQAKTFNIRGTTSINGGSPLVLIDNVPGDIDMLNPEDIEKYFSIERCGIFRNLWCTSCIWRDSCHYKKRKNRTESTIKL